MIARTPSSSMSWCAKEIAFSGVPSESFTISWIFLPSTPPAALIFSTSISAVFFSGAPRFEAGPVTEKMQPTLIGPDAGSAPSAAHAPPRTDASAAAATH